jgi:hypothetical protein
MDNKQNIRNPKFWVPSLYLAQGLPFFAVAIVANQMLKSMGVPNDELNHWTGLIGFAWVFKPLWSPFLELASSKKLVVVGFQIFGGLCLGGVALALHAPFWFAACMAMLALSPGIWLGILFILLFRTAKGRSRPSARCSCATPARSAAWACRPRKWARSTAPPAPPPSWSAASWAATSRPGSA